MHLFYKYLPEDPESTRGRERFPVSFRRLFECLDEVVVVVVVVVAVYIPPRLLHCLPSTFQMISSFVSKTQESEKKESVVPSLQHVLVEQCSPFVVVSRKKCLFASPVVAITTSLLFSFPLFHSSSSTVFME